MRQGLPDVVHPDLIDGAIGHEIADVLDAVVAHGGGRGGVFLNDPEVREGVWRLRRLFRERRSLEIGERRLRE